MQPMKDDFNRKGVESIATSNRYSLQKSRASYKSLYMLVKSGGIVFMVEPAEKQEACLGPPQLESRSVTEVL